MISGLVGGAIGAGIGAVAFAVIVSVGGVYSEWIEQPFNGIESFMICLFPYGVVGAIVGAISGGTVDFFGMKILSALPMIAFVGGCAGWLLGSIRGPRIYPGLLGLVTSVVIGLSVAMMSARRDHAMDAPLYRAARHGAFGAAIGGVTGVYCVFIFFILMFYESV